MSFFQSILINIKFLSDYNLQLFFFANVFMLQIEIQDFGAEAEYSFLPRNLCLLSS
jgi:hypothetical protein